MYDPAISMELSQHLFNIQVARYMHNVPRAELEKKIDKSGPAPRPSRTRLLLNVARELSDQEVPEVSSKPNARSTSTAHQAAPPPQTELATGIASLQAKVDESNDRLTKMADTLNGVKKLLTRTQQNYAQASG